MGKKDLRIAALDRENKILQEKIKLLEDLIVAHSKQQTYTLPNTSPYVGDNPSWWTGPWSINCVTDAAQTATIIGDQIKKGLDFAKKYGEQ
jgi:hypothetical protein